MYKLWSPIEHYEILFFPLLRSQALNVLAAEGFSYAWVLTMLFYKITTLFLHVLYYYFKNNCEVKSNNF